MEIIEEKKSTELVEESLLRDRMALYPGLYESVDELKEDLLAYGVELVKDETPLNPSNYRTVTEEAAATENEIDGTENNGSSSILTRQQTQIDVWGRLPPKEPKTMIDCPLCKRLVNTLRFASHLDKCMGIGTMSRASAPTR